MPKIKTRKITLPTMTRAASVVPKTLDEEKRSVEVVFTKGARVLRRGFFDTFFEELGLEKGQVRMERLESGTAPVLDNHGFTDKGGVRSTIGVVESAELVNGKEGRAVLRFSKRAEVDDIFQDIKDGILRNISVGYNTFRAEKVGEENDTPIFRAVDWEPVEISVVPAGADAGARIRSNKDEMTECVLVEPEEKKETEKEIKKEIRSEEPSEIDKGIEPAKNEKVEKLKNLRETQSIGDQAMPKIEEKEIEKVTQEARAQAKADEKKRQLEIRSIVKKVKLGDELADQYIDEDKSVDEVRTLVIDALAEKDKEPEKSTRATNTSAVVGEDLARKGRIEGMTSALLHKYRPQKTETRNEAGQKIVMPGYELAESGREFAFMSLVDMARFCVEKAGVKNVWGIPKHRIADMALNNVRAGLHSISDFPEILANVANKTLRDGYQAAPQTFEPFTSSVFVADFKEISRTNLGDAPKLEKLAEGSEIKRGSLSEAAEKYRIEEYAKIVAISRKVIVNDDLAAFTRIPERMGRRAADLESDVVWDVIKLNALLADGNALFSAAHGNLAADHVGAPSEDALGELREKMRRQVGLDGAEISIIPVWTFVPPALETAMEKLLATTRPTQPSEVNPFGPQGRTTLRMDVEPRLETGTGGSLTAWYGSADKGQIDMVELARLEGTDGPQIQSRDGFDVNGMEIKVMHDVAAKAIDFRGLFKNAGA